jgi:hypothetical protein
MGSNVYPSRAAEKVRFRELFRNASDVVRNGGVITGAPVFKDGGTFDGVVDKVTYPDSTDMRFYASDPFSIVLRFMGENDGTFSPIVQKRIGSNRYDISAAAGNVITMVVGDSGAAAVATSTAVVDDGKWHTIILAYNGAGKLDNYIDGNLEATSTAGGLATLDTAGADLTVGGGAGGLVVGEIRDLSIHNVYFTQADVDAIEDGSLWTYPSRTSVWLDMAEATAKAGTIRGVAELLTDGDMEAAGVGSWLKVNATLTKETTSPHGGTQCLRVAYDSADNPFTYQTSTTTAGLRYRATGWARSDGSKIPNLRDGSGITLWTGTVSTDWQYFDVVYIASSSYRLYSVGVGAGYCEFDDVSVVRTDELLSDGDMEATGTSAWTAGGGAALTKEGDAYAGLQCLRVTYGAINSRASQTPLTSGKAYQIIGRARSDGSRIPQVFNSALNLFIGTTDTNWQEFQAEFTATSTGLEFYVVGGTGYVEFDSVHVRPVLDRTLDKSPNGRVCLLGDGSTVAGIPAWQSPGFLFDGSTDYLTLPPDPTGTFTVAWKRRNEPTVFESNLTTWNLIKAAGGFSGLLDYLAWWPFTLSPLQQADLDQSWTGGR